MVTWLCLSWGHAGRYCVEELSGSSLSRQEVEKQGWNKTCIGNGPSLLLTPSHGHHATVTSSILKITALRIQSFSKDRTLTTKHHV